MWFDINFYTLALQILPTFLRKTAIAAFTQVLLKPVSTLYYKWNNYRAENIYRLEHTGQVCYLRKSLNDKFDPSERRIYIGEGNDFETTYIYTEAEQQDKYLGTLWLRTEAETDSNLDFIVYVPQEAYDLQFYAIKAHIEFYREAGARYAIFIIP